MATNKLSVLIVDDVPQDLLLLTALMEDIYSLTFATSATEAFHALDSQHLPDLILLDVMMPVTNGFAICQKIKKHLLWQHIPIIFLTALNEDLDEINAFEAGGSDFICKPFHPLAVMARMHVHLSAKLQLDALRWATPKHSLTAPDTDSSIELIHSQWHIQFSECAKEHPHCFRDNLGFTYLQILLVNQRQYFSADELILLTDAGQRITAIAAQPSGSLALTFLDNIFSASLAPIAQYGELLLKLRETGITFFTKTQHEQHRKSVTNALRRALAAIQISMPALFAHLQPPSLHFGHQMIYAPAATVIWQTTALEKTTYAT